MYTGLFSTSKQSTRIKCSLFPFPRGSRALSKCIYYGSDQEIAPNFKFKFGFFIPNIFGVLGLSPLSHAHTLHNLIDFCRFIELISLINIHKSNSVQTHTAIS